MNDTEQEKGKQQEPEEIDLEARAGARRIWNALTRLDRTTKLTIASLATLVMILPYLFSEQREVRERAAEQFPTPPSSNSADHTPPTVSFTYPQATTAVPRNATISLQAASSDDTGVTRVEFYRENLLLCTATRAPYTCIWHVPNQEKSTYTLEAVSFDAANNSSSTTVTVTVK